MLEQHFPASAVPSGDVFGPLEGGERAMWRGRAGVAEYAFDRAASLPRWTLPESTEVLITDRRVIYAYASDDEDLAITSGELRWLWPQYLRLQPGDRTLDRGGATTQIQLVCGASDGSYPALVFAGGELQTVSDADKVANVLRQAIARFRVDNASRLGLTTPQARMLSRLLIAPEFTNYQGGEGQTVTLQGALPVSRPTAVTAPPDPEPEPVTGEATRMMKARPGIEADASRAWAAARAEQVTQRARPGLASRAAELAARVADMVAAQAAEQRPPLPPPIGQQPAEQPLPAAPQWPPDPDPASFEVPTTNLAERAAALRRSTARFTANSAGSRVGGRRADREAGVTSRGRKT
jgi:hypothetical protein